MDAPACISLLSDLEPVRTYGKVSKVVGLIAEGKGIKAPLGAVCQLLGEEGNGKGVPAEVVGFRDDACLLMPYGDLRGISQGCLVQNTATPAAFARGQAVFGPGHRRLRQPHRQQGPHRSQALLPALR